MRSVDRRGRWIDDAVLIAMIQPVISEACLSIRRVLQRLHQVVQFNDLRRRLSATSLRLRNCIDDNDAGEPTTTWVSQSRMGCVAPGGCSGGGG